MPRCGIGLRGAACLLAIVAIGLAIAHSQDAKQTSHDLAGFFSIEKPSAN